MTAPEVKFFEELRSEVGSELGVTNWFVISQRETDMYAALVDDWDVMHNDPEWARSRFGGTIVHGFHVLSLVPHFLKEVNDKLPIVSTETGSVLNYGVDRVRIISPLLVGEEARDRMRLESVTEKRPGDYLVNISHTIEKHRDRKTCFYAESLMYFVTDYQDKWRATSK